MSLLKLRGLFVYYVKLSLAADDFAISTSFFYGCSDFHFFSFILFKNFLFFFFFALFVTEGYSGLGQIVRAHFKLHLVAGKDLDIVHPHFTGNMRCYYVPILKFYPEHGVAKCLNDRSVNFYI